MNGTDMASQLASTTMVETSNVSSIAMFLTSPGAHLYGGLYVPPGYQSLSGTFSGASSSLWTSPMSSTWGIPSGAALMSVSQPAPPPPPTLIVEQ